jgi:hypothetical protein
MKRTAGIALLGLFTLSAQAGPADPGLLVGVSGMLTSYEIDGDVFDDEAVGAKLSVQYRINRLRRHRRFVAGLGKFRRGHRPREFRW